MKIETMNEQTRRTNRFSGTNAKNKILNDFTKSVTSISTNTQQSIQHGDNWAKRNSTTTYDLDNYLPRNLELSLRMENSLRESMAVYMSLFIYDGIMSAKAYNKVIEEIEENYNQICKTLKGNSYILSLTQDGEFVGMKLFEDEARLYLWCNTHLGIDYKLLLNPMTIPENLKGTHLCPQDWCTNPDEFFKIVKSQS